MKFGRVIGARYRPDRSKDWIRFGHVLADNEQMRARAQRMKAHLNTEDRTLAWAQPLAVPYTEDEREDDRARHHVEGVNVIVERFLGPLRDLQRYRQAEIDRDIMIARLEKAGVADMVVSDVLNGNITNPITAEIERTVDELVRLCRVAGQLEADLNIRGRKRHTKAELKRLNKIVDGARQHLLHGITAIRKSNNKNMQGE